MLYLKIESGCRRSSSTRVAQMTTSTFTHTRRCVSRRVPALVKTREAFCQRSAAARSVCVNGPLEARARVRTSLEGFRHHSGVRVSRRDVRWLYCCCCCCCYCIADRFVIGHEPWNRTPEALGHLVEKGTDSAGIIDINTTRRGTVYL